jgi:hypothetical protein
MLFTAAIASLLPLLSLAAPALERRAETCAILGTNVNCRYHADINSQVITKFSGGTKYFTCTQYGSCVNGNWYVLHRVRSRLSENNYI